MYIVCHIDCKLELHGADFAMIKGIAESHGIGKGAVSTWDCYTTSRNNDHRQNVVSYRVKEGSFIFQSTHIQNVHRFIKKSFCAGCIFMKVKNIKSYVGFEHMT